MLVTDQHHHINVRLFDKTPKIDNDNLPLNLRRILIFSPFDDKAGLMSLSSSLSSFIIKSRSSWCSIMHMVNEYMKAKLWMMDNTCENMFFVLAHNAILGIDLDTQMDESKHGHVHENALNE